MGKETHPFPLNNVCKRNNTFTLSRMKLKSITVGIMLPVAVSGCADTSVSYSKWTPDAQIQSTSLKFLLQESTVTLQSSSGQGSAGKPGQATKPSCESLTWWTCFSGTTAVAAPTASGLTEGTPLVATPNTGNPFQTTTISGTAITGQDGLYSSITVKVTNNTSSLVTAAGTGAAAGFGIGGPYGAAVGAGAGFIAAALAPPAAAAPAPVGGSPPPPPPQRLGPYLCLGEKVDLSNTAADPKAPAIIFPIAIMKLNNQPLAPSSELTGSRLPVPGDGACWHVLPNTAALTTPIALAQAPAAARQPTLDGDGWLYRFVAVADQEKPDGAEATADFLSGKIEHSDQTFPYSSCRKAILQITWWSELNSSIDKGVPPRVVVYAINIADPNYVYLARVQKGGVINFKPDCGANISLNVDGSAAAILNAIVTQGEGVAKAEQTWASSAKK